MKTLPSTFQVYKESTKHSKYWANYADENVLLRTHPHTKAVIDLTDPVMQYMSTAAPGLASMRTPLQDYLGMSGRTREVDSDYITWKLRGTGKVTAVALENLWPTSECPGIQGTEFSIKLDVEWFVPGDVLMPVIAKECQVIVQGLPIADGPGFIYPVVLADESLNAYFLPELLEPRLKWMKLDSVYSEASRGYGSTVFSGMSYVQFQTDLTDEGKQVEVTNKAHDLNLRVVACDAKGMPMKDYPDQIISYIEAEFLKQFKWEKELRLFYGRSAGKKVIDGSVGYHRRVGPGLLEFMEDGNVIDYPVNGGSISMFKNFLTQIWFDRVPYEQRSVTFYTGQGGLTLANEWLTEEYNMQPIQMNHKDFTKPGKSYSSSHSGFTIGTNRATGINLYPFGEIRFEHWPILDSMELNGALLHPETGLPLSSYEFIAMDYGLGDGRNNIELLKRRDSEVFTYKCGVWSPLGPINTRTGRGGFVSSGPERSYILYATCTQGVRVRDVNLLSWFRPCVTH